MRFILTYTHTRNIFIKNEFKPFVKKYFKDVRFLGCDSGNWNPKIEISNWEDIKYQLPKYAIPIEIKLSFGKDGAYSGFAILDALVHGQLGQARQIRGEDSITY